ncbi:hypothetical protein GCM10007148_20550 [Parvularcula lutaonensis]|nr:hypothetical protein GCM10007148_20550 [Parvularcula lutaonensis]
MGGCYDAPSGARLIVRVSQPPEGGKANKAVCAAVAEALGLPPRAVTVARGQTSRDKTLAIDEAPPDFDARVQRLLDA